MILKEYCGKQKKQLMKKNLKILFSPTIQNKIPGLKIGILSSSDFEVNNNSDFVDRQFADLEKFIKDTIISLKKLN